MLNLNPYHGMSISPGTSTKTRPPTSILIIDDDIDSALMVQTVFSRLGCQTTVTLEIAEAKHKICSLKADIIILDWILEPFINGGQVVSQCSESLSRFGDLIQQYSNRKPQIVTYSGLSESEIRLPENPFFEHSDHWKKPITQREILMRALSLLNEAHVRDGR